MTVLIQEEGMAAIARRPVGACKIMITHIRFMEKMQPK